MAVVQPIFNAIEGDTTTKIIPTCRDAYTRIAINLTGATVTFRYRYRGTVTPIVERTMSITDFSGGVAEYQFVTSELVPGFIDGEIVVVVSGKTNISKRFGINVVKRVA